MKQIKYGLKHKKTNRVIGYYTTSNADGEFCTDTQYILDYCEDNIWGVDTKEHAEWVRCNSTKWYNANYNTPTHNFKPNELVVVEIRINLHEIEVTLPTYEEIAKFKSRGNQRDYDFYMMNKKKHPEITFDLYYLNEMLREKKKVGVK